ncbi:uncharacterized protein LOC111385675 [Olea europaea var. sylvestris]|uniref:uncharacterized protein LOC111385675 n=1 Tax=Olea europaea var. sylvestris TaxID=158386 RepID=UPI000C1D6F3B|nr:uncharacterized protein LOC111385675 [Olea europaea var. sylvestris]
MRIAEVEEIVMENIDKNIVLKVNLNCCEECPKKLEKALLKLTVGVSSLAIDTEKNLLSISGTMDSDTLRKLIYVEIGKKAKVVFCDTNNVGEKKPNTTKTMGDGDSKNESNYHFNGKMHKNCCYCLDGKCHKTKENNEHKCEAYEGPPKVKDFVCRKGKMHKSCCCCLDGNCHKTKENNKHKCEAYEEPPKVKDFVCRDYFKGKMHKSCCCCLDENCHKTKENNKHKCEAYEGPPKVKDFVCRDYFKEKTLKSCCYCLDGNYHKTKENNEHKCEAYEGPPKVKDFVCRDYFCKIHPRSLKITDRVPANESSASMLDHFPGHYGGPNPWYPIRSSYYPRWYPEQLPTRYRYFHPLTRPQPPYGYGFY